MPTVNDHSYAMANALKKIATLDNEEEKKNLLKDFYGSSAVLIDDLFPGTGLGYAFAQTQIDKIDQKELN